MLTLITPAQGNPIALKRTLDSVVGLVDEVIIGSVCVFEEDEKIFQSYGDIMDVRIMQFPFNTIFKNGFSHILNELSSYAKNDLVVYLNVGEICITPIHEILQRISSSYTCYYIDHPTETHHWYRVYNKKEVRWGGIIHEEIIGNLKGSGFPLFRFDDTPKDSDSALYAKIMNDVKECVYFNLYLKLAEQPQLVGNTNQGWVQFAKEGFNGFIERLHKKGILYDAFLLGDRDLLEKYVNEQP